MSLCINPNCSRPDHPGNNGSDRCQNCHAPLLLLERYRVTRLLSDNTGFGTVYEANDGSDEKILKVLKIHAPKAIELFQQESQILSQFAHPGIPKIDCYFSITPDNGKKPLHCLVMEKIQGQNLQTWLQQNSPLDSATAIDWLKQSVSILDCVHQQNFFHRDIKPANIMLRPDGQLALIDFGTAREITQTYLAKMGGASGVTSIASAGYTPLEQNNGKAVPQSDFYALGRTFVYLLTGKHPTDLDDDVEQGRLLWQAAVEAPFPPLLALIDDMMAPFPAQRPRDTRHLLERLGEIERIYETYRSDPSILDRYSPELPRDRPPASLAQVPRDSTARQDAIPVAPTEIHLRAPRPWKLGSAAALVLLAASGVGWWQVRSQPVASTSMRSLTIVLPETSELPLPEVPPSPVAPVAAPTPVEKAAPISLEDSDKQVKLEVRSLGQKPNFVVLEIRLQNQNNRPVRFLSNFIELTDEQEQKLSGVPEGLPEELPPNGKVVSGTLEIPKGLLVGVEFITLKITNPEEEIALKIPKIPLAEFADGKPPQPLTQTGIGDEQNVNPAPSTSPSAAATPAPSASPSAAATPTPSPSPTAAIP